MCCIPHPLHIRCAPVPCLLHSSHLFRGLAAQRDCSFRALRSSLTTALQSQTRRWYRCAMCLCPDTLFEAAVSSFVDAGTVRIPVVPPFSVQSLLCSAVFRGVIGAFPQTAPTSLTASSLRCLIRSRLLRHHFGTHLAPAAGLSRFNLSGLLLQLDCQCKRRSDRYTPLEPHSVRRLPRPTPTELNRAISRCSNSLVLIRKPVMAFFSLKIVDKSRFTSSFSRFYIRYKL